MEKILLISNGHEGAPLPGSQAACVGTRLGGRPAWKHPASVPDGKVQRTTAGLSRTSPLLSTLPGSPCTPTPGCHFGGPSPPPAGWSSRGLGCAASGHRVQCPAGTGHPQGHLMKCSPCSRGLWERRGKRDFLAGGGQGSLRESWPRSSWFLASASWK